VHTKQQLDPSIHFDRTPTRDRQTDRHRAIAIVPALAQRRAGNNTSDLVFNVQLCIRARQRRHQTHCSSTNGDVKQNDNASETIRKIVCLKHTLHYSVLFCDGTRRYGVSENLIWLTIFFARIIRFTVQNSNCSE